ncbi:hypothetical protein ACVIHH_003670 [Bradyrhizobium sp. USDA 4518]
MTFFASNWTVAKRLYDDDDDTPVLYRYDANNTNTWNVLQTNYDTAFHRTQEVLTNDDGTHWVLTCDQNGSHFASVTS